MKTKEQVIEDISTLRSRFEDGKFLYEAPHEVVIEAMELYIFMLNRLIGFPCQDQNNQDARDQMLSL